MRQRPLPLRRDRRRRPLYRRSISRVYRAASDRAVAEYVTLTTGNYIAGGTLTRASRRLQKKTRQPPRRLPSAMKMRIQLRAATCLACAPAQRTPFSARAGWAEGRSNTPATERARDLQREALSFNQQARDPKKGVKQGQPCIIARGSTPSQAPSLRS